MTYSIDDYDHKICSNDDPRYFTPRTNLISSAFVCVQGLKLDFSYDKSLSSVFPIVDQWLQITGAL